MYSRDTHTCEILTPTDHVPAVEFSHLPIFIAPTHFHFTKAYLSPCLFIYFYIFVTVSIQVQLHFFYHFSPILYFILFNLIYFIFFSYFNFMSCL